MYFIYLPCDRHLDMGFSLGKGFSLGNASNYMSSSSSWAFIFERAISLRWRLDLHMRRTYTCTCAKIPGFSALHVLALMPHLFASVLGTTQH